MLEGLLWRFAFFSRSLSSLTSLFLGENKVNINFRSVFAFFIFT